MNNEAVYWIEVEKIVPNPYQPRKDFDPESLKELAESIKEYGILEPLLVSRKEIQTDKGMEVVYELIVGERRLQAAKMIGLEKVPAIVKQVSERSKLEIALIENLQRKDLNPVERAKGLARLIEEFKLTQMEIAKRIGKSRAFVANTLRLLKLPDEILQALSEGKISESQARLFLEVDDVDIRKEVFFETLEKNLTTRAIEKRIREKLREKNKESLDEWSEKLRNILGKEVKVEKFGEELKVEIKLMSEEELVELIKRLTKSPETGENIEGFELSPNTQQLFPDNF